MTEEKVRFIQRTNSTNSWILYNPILRKGEIGIEETNTGLYLIKIGDGETPWNNLPYAEPYTDKTLSLHDYAADAWAVGARIGYVENLIKGEISSRLISSFAPNTELIPLGQTTSVTLSWIYTDDSQISAQYINNELVNINLRSKTYSLSSTQTFTLRAVDINGNEVTAICAVIACAAVYYGVATEPQSYTSQFVTSLTSKTNNNTEDYIEVNATTDKYIYYCAPTRYGTKQAEFNNILGGLGEVGTCSITNGTSTESYTIYRSNYPSLGQTKLKIIGGTV